MSGQKLPEAYVLIEKMLEISSSDVMGVLALLHKYPDLHLRLKYNGIPIEKLLDCFDTLATLSNLEKLELHGFTMMIPHFHNYANGFSNLKTLAMVDLPNLTTLEGVQFLPALRELAVNNCASLKDTTAIGECTSRLTTISIKNCQYVWNYEWTRPSLLLKRKAEAAKLSDAKKLRRSGRTNGGVRYYDVSSWLCTQVKLSSVLSILPSYHGELYIAESPWEGNNERPKDMCSEAKALRRKGIQFMDARAILGPDSSATAEGMLANKRVTAAVTHIVRTLQHDKPVLVFCKAGENRSSAIVCMVLVALGASAEDAVRIVADTKLRHHRAWPTFETNGGPKFKEVILATESQKHIQALGDVN